MAYTAVDVDELLNIMKQQQGERTQLEYANQLGVSPQYLCDVYAKRREPGPSVLQAMSSVRSVSYMVPETLIPQKKGISHDQKEVRKARSKGKVHSQKPRLG